MAGVSFYNTPNYETVLFKGGTLMKEEKRCLKCGCFADEKIGNAVECPGCGNTKEREIRPLGPRPTISEVAKKIELKRTKPTSTNGWT
jgi:uncharacterized Zn finger protein (UPF0148 family)